MCKCTFILTTKAEGESTHPFGYDESTRTKSRLPGVAVVVHGDLCERCLPQAGWLLQLLDGGRMETTSREVLWPIHALSQIINAKTLAKYIFKLCPPSPPGTLLVAWFRECSRWLWVHVCKEWPRSFLSGLAVAGLWWCAEKMAELDLSGEKK